MLYTSRWWTTISAASDIKVDVAKQSKLLVETARTKLLSSTRLVAEFNYYQKDKPLGLWAVVDCRLQIDYVPHRQDALAKQADMIASHMRTVYSIPSSRDHIRSAYPSEPFLGEAAAQQMSHFRNERREFLQQQLHEHLSSGLIEVGERGELVARALLLEAYDLAVINSKRYSNPTDGIRFSHGCTVVEFITALFSPSVVDTVLKAVSDTAGGEADGDLQLGDRFQKAWIRFTQFDRLGDETTVSAFGALTGFMRCAAFICKRNQYEIDFLIPVLLDPNQEEDSLFSEANVTAIFIQVKNSSVTLTDVNITADALEFFPKVLQPPAGKQPYIALSMQLGRNAPEKQPILEATQGSSNRATRSHANPSQIPTKHHRYNIRAYSCSSEAYNIPPEVEKYYDQLLKVKDVIDEHPRTDARFRTAVRRLSPFHTVKHSEEWSDARHPPVYKQTKAKK
jgi:hypothetical protein